MRTLAQAVVLIVFSALAIHGAAAQETVHAVSGTVISIHPKVGTIELNTDDGSSGDFECLKSADHPLNFNKDVKANSIAAAKFTGNGNHVILYYFGDGDVRTAVAIHDLGKTQVTEISGTVIKFNRHDRTLLLKSSAGKDESFNINPETVGDTPTGVAQNFKFDFNKGNAVTVTSTQTNGTQAALLIEPTI